MARLLCQSDINFTSSSWKTIDSTSFSASESASAQTGTSYVSSSNFTPGAITVEGFMIRIRGTASSSGTFSAELYNATSSASVAGTEVTINVSDIYTMKPEFPSGSFTTGGFFYMKFASPVTLLAATNYNLRIKTSVAGSVYVNVSAGTNYSRALVTSTTAAPGANDDLYVCAPFTTTSTPSVVTCTMNNTASTDFGLIEVGGFGKMTLENSASTTYILNVSDTKNFTVCLNGSVEFGTTSSRINSTSTFTLNLKATGLGTNGLLIRPPASFQMAGTDVTRQAKLAANASAGATSLTTDVSTGWKNGDLIAFSNTTRAAARAETKALTADASGTILTVSALTNAKEGTSPVQCDIGNLTSNAKIYGTSTTSTCYIALGASFNAFAGSLILDNVEIRYIGSSNSDKYGIMSYGSTGSTCTINKCAFYDGNSSARYYIPGNGTGNFDNFTVTNNVFYAGSIAFDLINITTINPTTGTFKFNNNLMIENASSGIRIGTGNPIGNMNLEVKNNIQGGGSTSFGYQLSFGGYNGLTLFDNNKAYGQTGTNSSGVYFVSCTRSSLGSFTAYRANTQSFLITTASDFICESITGFGSTNRNLMCNNSIVDLCVFKNVNLQAGTGETCPVGIYLGTSARNLILENANIGTVTSHSTADVNVGYTFFGELVIVNGTLGSSTKVASQTKLSPFGRVSVQRSGGVAANNFSYLQYGRIDADSTIYDTAPMSIRLTPSSATYEQRTSLARINLINGQSATIKVKLRKSVSEDGAAYNGSVQPKIYMRANSSAGSSFDGEITAITADNSCNGAWVQYTYTTPTASDNTAVEFFLGAIGTAGWVNADTLRVS